MNKKVKIIISVLIVPVILVIFATVIGAIYFFVSTRNAELDIEKLQGNFSNVKIYDNQMQEIQLKNNNYVKISDISPNIINTFVSVEDKRFYKHKGVDYKRIISASAKNLVSMSFKEGASTITQQLIKNTHLTNKKTIDRKLNEIRLAWKLEKVMSKEQIMEKYLNNIYFGGGIYGVYDACLAFYNKPPSKVNLAEACMLVGVVKNPSQNSPLNNLNGAIKRKNVILNILDNDENFDKKSVENAKNTNIILENGLIKNKFNLSFIKNALFESTLLLGINENTFAKNGYKVITYLDSELQQANFINSLSYTQDNNFVRCVVDNKTLGVTSYITNLSVIDNQIKRQAGSVIKPFSVYLPCYEQKIINPLTQILDEKTDFNGYSPKNFNDVYHGYVSVQDSVAHSYNVPAVKLLSQLGISNSTDFLSRYKFKISDDEKNLSLALGTNAVSPLQIASAYCSIANDGYYKNASFVKQIIDKNGKIVYKNNKDFEQVCDKSCNFLMRDNLILTVQNGTGYKLKNFNFQVACKTGTVANANKKNTDAWCCAFTSENTFLVWNGAKEEFLKDSHTGSSYPALAIKDMIQLQYKNKNPENFTIPEGVILKAVNMEKLKKDNIVEVVDDEFIGEKISAYFSIDNLPKNTKMPVEFVLKRGLFENILQFNAEINKKYNIYRLDGEKKILIKSIVCNGDCVKIIDNVSIFSNYEYYVEQIED